MKRLILLLATLFITAVSATVMADTPKDLGPEIINLKMGIMVLPLNHRKHQAILNNECFHCHTKASPGKIAGWGQMEAHKICIACHDLEEKGPVECNQCHVK